MSFQLLGIQPIDALDLRNHFVTASVDVEAVDKISADTGREIGADLLHVEAERRDFVVIENDLGLRLVDLRIDVAELENMRLPSLSRKFASRTRECVPGRRSK